MVTIISYPYTWLSAQQQIQHVYIWILMIQDAEGIESGFLSLNCFISSCRVQNEQFESRRGVQRSYYQSGQQEENDTVSWDPEAPLGQMGS